MTREENIRKDFSEKIYPSMVIRSQDEAIKLLEQENQKLRDEIMELHEYKKAVYEIKKYINAYSPYFLETQEQNNQTIATIIHNIGDYNND